MTNYTRISVIILALWSLSSHVWASDKQLCEGNASVYIDPFFGGREDGPSIGVEHKSKNLTLNFGLKLRAVLEKMGITACLSRESDYSLSLDERLVKAKISQAKVHFAVTISSKKKGESCINLYIPRETPQIRKEKDINVESILNDIRSDEKEERSLVLAHQIRQSIGENLKHICLKVLARDKALLTKSHGPTIIIDFSVSEDSLPFMRKTILSDNFINVVAGALASRLTPTQRNP